MRKVSFWPVYFYSPKTYGAFFAYTHAYETIHGRWEEAEPYIMKDPHWACSYARNILKQRWPEAEQVIMKDPEYAYYYACDVIGKRWSIAEPYIKGSAWQQYYETDFDCKL